ncbi:hypothetical protein IOMTU133_6424 [Pseudomonas aeruginosa]|nr:hypothetical protein IOMTU133_6424 [Pseudomonas aeruginosa]
MVALFRRHRQLAVVTRATGPVEHCFRVLRRLRRNGHRNDCRCEQQFLHDRPHQGERPRSTARKMLCPFPRALDPGG